MSNQDTMHTYICMAISRHQGFCYFFGNRNKLSATRTLSLSTKGMSVNFCCRSTVCLVNSLLRNLPCILEDSNYVLGGYHIKGLQLHAILYVFYIFHLNTLYSKCDTQWSNGSVALHIRPFISCCLYGIVFFGSAFRFFSLIFSKPLSYSCIFLLFMQAWRHLSLPYRLGLIIQDRMEHMFSVSACTRLFSWYYCTFIC